MMGHEERCERDAKVLYPQMDLLAMAARNRSWEPGPWLATAVMRAALNLAAEMAEYTLMPEHPKDE